MFRLVVREHIMIAHSFKGEVFGPAQKLHGATFVVDLELSRPALDRDGIVCDIGLLSELLASVLKPLNYQNLDELPVFPKGLPQTPSLFSFYFISISFLYRKILYRKAITTRQW